MARSFFAIIYIACLAPCAASAQSDADTNTVFTIRSFQSNFFSAFATRNLRFLSVPMEKHRCTDEALARLPWRDTFIEALLLDWGIEESKSAQIMNYARKLIGDKYVPLAYEMARAEDGACSYRTFFTSSREVEEKLNSGEQERLRNWLPSVRGASAPGEGVSELKDSQGGATQQVSAMAGDLAQERERSKGLDRDLANAREEIRILKAGQADAAQQMSATTADLARERERSQGLEGALAAARDEIRSLKAAQGDAAQRVSATAADLTQERERSQGLERDLAAAREEVSQLKDSQGGATQQVSSIAADLAQERERSKGLDRDLANAREEIRILKAGQGDATQQASAAAAQLIQERDRSEGLANDLATTREEIRILKAGQGDAAQQMSATAAELARERERSQGLGHGLASAREEIDKLKDVQESAAQQTSGIAAELAQERERSQKLDGELAAARQQISTFMDIRAVVAHQGDAAQQVSAAAEESARKGGRSLILDRNLTAAGEETGVLAAHQRESPEQAAFAVQALEPERSPSPRLDHAADRHEMNGVKAIRAGADAAASSPKSPRDDADDGAPRNSSESGAPARAIPDTRTVAEAPSGDTPRRIEQETPNPATSEDKLLARAHALVLQGNIDGARLWLERAIATGSARAEFDLAQTYDPHVLSIWKTYGVRGDLAKARDLYSRAYSRGITEAKERIEGLE